MTVPKAVRTRRADATRNRDAIIDAALERLNANPTASIADISAAAGISRITFYGHFSSREKLLDAVVERTTDRIERQLSQVRTDEAPWPALERLVQTQWRLVGELNGIVLAAEHLVPAERIHELHARPIARVHELIDAGRQDGTFRTDHSLQWQVACFFAILHGAAAELRSGRLTEDQAAHVIPETVQALLQSRPMA